MIKVVFFLLLSLAALQSSAQAIAEPDRTILMNIYNSTGGSSWNNNTNWGSSTYPWYGVTVDAAGRVTKLSLNSNNLVGTLPDISGLTNLTFLLLSSNKISGSIPNLSTLTNLTYFNVSVNQLTGSIPSLTGLTKLQTFDCGINQLTGSIPSLTGLTNLNYFNCIFNQLTGSIPSFEGLTNLWGFDCFFNQLDGTIPADFNKATNISQFQCGGNKLTGELPSLTGLSKLKIFDCANNQLSGSIPKLSGQGLSSLEYFVVIGNQLSGIIPSVEGINTLTRFICIYNNFTGFESFVKTQTSTSFNWYIHTNYINFDSFDKMLAITDPTTQEFFKNNINCWYNSQTVPITITKTNTTVSTDLAEGATPANYTYHWYKRTSNGSGVHLTDVVGSNSIDLATLANAGLTPADDLYVTVTHNTYSVLTNAAGTSVSSQKYLSFTSNIISGMALDVTFGNISAIITNGQLVVNWSTLTETNNDHFIVEISKDGKNFTKLAQLQTKALDGNSSSQISYSHSTPLSTAMGLFATFGLLGIGAAGLGRKKKWWVMSMIVFAIAFAFSCNKNEVTLETNKGTKIFVRIAQVDKDGTVKYSKIQQAIQE